MHKNLEQLIEYQIYQPKFFVTKNNTYGVNLMVPIDMKWIGYLPVVVGAAVVGTAVVVASGTI